MEITQVTIDYQQIVDIVAQGIQLGMPIGIVFGVASRLVRFALSCITGKEQVKL